MGRLLIDVDRELLHEFGISRQLISDWKTARKLPTLPQAYILAALTNECRHKMADRLAMARSTEKQASLLRMKFALDGLAAHTREGFTFPA